MINRLSPIFEETNSQINEEVDDNICLTLFYKSFQFILNIFEIIKNIIEIDEYDIYGYD